MSAVMSVAYKVMLLWGGGGHKRGEKWGVSAVHMGSTLLVQQPPQRAVHSARGLHLSERCRARLGGRPDAAAPTSVVTSGLQSIPGNPIEHEPLLGKEVAVLGDCLSFNGQVAEPSSLYCKPVNLCPPEYSEEETRQGGT